MSIRPANPAAQALGTQALDDQASVRLAGVAKRFGGVTALQETWLDVAPGEFLTLLGPSGCGKTTLLNLVAGFLDPDAGSVVVGGEDVTDLPPHARGLGLVFQGYALFPHMSVADNVGYGLRARGVGRAEVEARVAQMLDLVHLGAYCARRPGQLSGGQQQRVALARALVIRPRVLLLDEPFSALDKALRGAMQVELKSIQRRLGVTTIFVTHDQGEALSLSDRVAVMSQGRVRQAGTPREIYLRPRDRFVASFVGEVNVLAAVLAGVQGDRAQVRAGDAVLDTPADLLAGAAPGTALDLLVRPERLALTHPGSPAIARGEVVAHAYAGGHADLHLETPAARDGRLVVRVAGVQALEAWPVGARAAVVADGAGEGAVAFPAGGE